MAAIQQHTPADIAATNDDRRGATGLPPVPVTKQRTSLKLLQLLGIPPRKSRFDVAGSRPAMCFRRLSGCAQAATGTDRRSILYQWLAH
jgi:hypothetical protein